ncbi:MAG TPA: carbon-nitrogen hydrolase family protein [Kineosporiaceae bacterium]
MIRVAVVQAGSVYGDCARTLERLRRLVERAADEGARLAVFPEAFLGGYPKGLTFDAPVGRRTEAGRLEYLRYSGAAVGLRGPEMAQVADLASRTGVFLVVGMVERSGGTLYCTAAMVDPGRGLVGHHRKLMPTAAERLVWGFGDGSTIGVVDSPAGRVGAAICWENYMPMLRQAMYAQGVDVYCAPTVDDREVWQHTMRHIALEGRCFVLSACQFACREDYPTDYRTTIEPDADGAVIRGGSVIVGPLGEILAGPEYGRECLLVADVDLDRRIAGHFDLDVAGHYARPDVFQLLVDDRPKRSVSFASSTDDAAGDG